MGSSNATAKPVHPRKKKRNSLAFAFTNSTTAHVFDGCSRGLLISLLLLLLSSPCLASAISPLCVCAFPPPPPFGAGTLRLLVVCWCTRYLAPTTARLADHCPFLSRIAASCLGEHLSKASVSCVRLAVPPPPCFPCLFRDLHRTSVPPRSSPFQPLPRLFIYLAPVIVAVAAVHLC